MRNKTAQILDAATRVFISKGFIQATTQEIAKEANVAEITLFRKFSTKQNLFELVIKKALEENFQSKLSELAAQTDMKTLFHTLLEDRLIAISRNEALVKMLIAESIMGHLPPEIDFTHLFFRSLLTTLQRHPSLSGEEDAEFCARQIGGLLLGHAILPSSCPFHQLDQSGKDELLTRYTNSLLATNAGA